MELVYLWVGKYKNIKEQGFNFSPRFNCKFYNKYDENGKLKDNCKLEIIDKEEIGEFYPKNFFDENINITAIVGENGSGKSTILKLLHKDLSIWGCESFAIFINKENEKFYLSKPKKYPFLNEFKELHSNDKVINFPFFEYSFTYDRDLDYLNGFIYPKKQIMMTKGVIHLIKELIQNQKNILLNYFDLKKTKQLDKFESFFVPKTINIFFDTRTIKSNERFPQLISDVENKLSKIKSSITHHKTTQEFIEILKSISKLLTDSQSYEKLSNPIDYFNPQSEFSLGSSDTQEEEYLNLWHPSFQAYNNAIDLNELSKIKNIQYLSSNKTWIDESDIHMYSFDIDNLDKRAIEVIMTSFSSYQFTVQLCDINNRALNDLSFGEQQLLFILNQLYSLKNNQINGIKSIRDRGQEHEIEISENIDNYIILLDEIDIGWHPDWQKKLVSYICDFLKLLLDKNFHLVFATHSPFILSDLPKENVIFLKKDENGNCKNVTSETNIDTFGANIHTLLSHGFFMENGLMGEFAKGKISKVLRFLNGKNKFIDLSINIRPPLKIQTNFFEKNLRPIIELIGEEFLREKLLNMYRAKFNIKSKDEEIAELKAEIERLKNGSNKI